MAKLSIKVNGLDRVRLALQTIPKQIGRYTAAAGTEAATEILDTTGVRLYPASGPANEPPTPYYIRGQGTQLAGRNRGESQRLGTQFTVETRAYSFTTAIGNRATYAPYVVGDDQARAMARIGWRKIYDVAVEKLGKLGEIYQGWIDKMIRDLGL